MRFRKLPFVFIILFILLTNVYGQKIGKGKVSGIILDETSKKPIEFVNVALVQLSDSSVTTGTVTNSNGEYKVENVSDGKYFLLFSFIGYKDEHSQILEIGKGSNNIDLGSTTLAEADINLDEVTITSNKVMLSNSIDRKTYNVQQDIMSKTGSASDLLQNIPSVQVDIDGNVSLRGSTNVLMLINGKTSPLMGKTRAEVLRQMPASSIEKIEVITNPSAKYKPDGTSGIINIVIKKETESGLNGGLTLNLGNDSRYNATGSANYNTNGLNLFGRYSFRQDDRSGFSDRNRTQFDSLTGSPFYYQDKGSSKYRPYSHGFALGFDYDLDYSNSFGASGNYYYRAFTRKESNKKIFKNSDFLTTEKYERARLDYEYEDEIEAAAYFEHNFPEEDHTLRVDVNTASSPEEEDNRYSNIYIIPNVYTTFDNTLIKQKSNDTQITVEYSDPLSDNSTIEAGYDGEFNKKDLDFFGEYFEPSQQKFIKDIEKTNHFIYNENIHAVYATYSNEFGELGVLGGVRLEQAQLKSNLVSSGEIISNNYFNLYPTLHLAYKLSEVSELQLNYSRRANRPEDDELNPFPEYRDPRNIYAGNPHLKPEFIHSYEFGYQWQNDYLNIVPSLFYRDKYNGFTSVTRAIDDSTFLTTRKNLATDQSAGLEIVLSGNAGNFLSANLSANAFYEQIDASNIGFSSNKSTTTWSSNFSCNMNLTSSTMLQINSNYRSKRLTPQGEYKPNFVLNLGLRQDLLDEKLSLILTVSDVFNSLRRESNITTDWLVENSISSRNARIIYVGATYHFGKTSKKENAKSLQYDIGL